MKKVDVYTFSRSENTNVGMFCTDVKIPQLKTE